MPGSEVRAEEISDQMLRIAKQLLNNNEGAGLKSFLETRNNANSIAWQICHQPNATDNYQLESTVTRSCSESTSDFPSQSDNQSDCDTPTRWNV